MLLKFFIGQIDAKLLKTAMYKEQRGNNKTYVNHHYQNFIRIAFNQQYA